MEYIIAILVGYAFLSWGLYKHDQDMREELRELRKKILEITGE